MAAKVVKDDTVVVLTGRDRGKEGKVTRVMPTLNRVVVEGLNRRIRHVKARQPGEAAGRVEFDAPIAVSNVAVVCSHCQRGVRVGFKFLDDGVKVRVCRKCGEIVEKKKVSRDG
ncbi:MAG: 50S ribosomal protein L24 [Chloroflexota bacterium]